MKGASQIDAVTDFAVASARPSGIWDKCPSFDHRGNSAPSIQSSGPAHSLDKAPRTSTHRLHRAGYTVPPVAGSDFDFPFLPREYGLPCSNFAKEIRYDQSNSA